MNQVDQNGARQGPAARPGLDPMRFVLGGSGTTLLLILGAYLAVLGCYAAYAVASNQPGLLDPVTITLLSAPALMTAVLVASYTVGRLGPVPVELTVNGIGFAFGYDTGKTVAEHWNDPTIFLAAKELKGQWDRAHREIITYRYWLAPRYGGWLKVDRETYQLALQHAHDWKLDVRSKTRMTLEDTWVTKITVRPSAEKSHATSEARSSA